MKRNSSVVNIIFLSKRRHRHEVHKNRNYTMLYQTIGLLGLAVRDFQCYISFALMSDWTNVLLHYLSQLISNTIYMWPQIYSFILSIRPMLYPFIPSIRPSLLYSVILSIRPMRGREPRVPQIVSPPPKSVLQQARSSIGNLHHFN